MKRLIIYSNLILLKIILIKKKEKKLIIYFILEVSVLHQNMDDSYIIKQLVLDPMLYRFIYMIIHKNFLH